MEQRVKLDDVVKELLRDVDDMRAGGQQISDDQLLALHTIFGETLLHAVTLLDKRKVTRLKSPNGRSIFEVVGRGGRTYSLLGSENFCTCESFERDVLLECKTFTCKHVLAVWLAKCMGAEQERSISDVSMGVKVMAAVGIGEEVVPTVIEDSDS